MQIENGTRWSSTYLMLETFMKAYKKGCFTSNYKCPASFNLLELYFNILFPIYILSLKFQKTDANISIIIPELLLLISNLKK